MIAIDVGLARANGNPFSYRDLTPVVNQYYVELIEFFNSCVADSLILNTTIPYTDNMPHSVPPHTTRYYAINTDKATEFQERFMSDTAPFSVKQMWAANGFSISNITQTQIVFEDEPADELLDLVDVDDNILWGSIHPYSDS